MYVTIVTDPHPGGGYNKYLGKADTLDEMKEVVENYVATVYAPDLHPWRWEGMHYVLDDGDPYSSVARMVIYEAT